MADETETQVQAAQWIYDARAPTYENSFHPAYSRRLMDIVHPQPGHRVLVLACGTGLESFMAAEQVGPNGQVVGVDVSEGMLALARERQAEEAGLGERVRFLSGDITRLHGIEGLHGKKFDLIICSNAFVLLGEPGPVVRDWKGWLNHGGRLVVDITHEQNFISGTILERTAESMGTPFPMSRRWIESRDSFKDVLESEGFVLDKVLDLEKISGQGNTFYDIDDADEQFLNIVSKGFTPKLFSEERKEQARAVFRKEWAKAAVGGKVENVDVLYVYIARAR